jgi:hypothetical protein
VQQLHGAFSDLGKYAAHALDTGSRDADTVGAELQRLLANGEFILDLML